MPLFEVEYSYDVPTYGVTTVVAKDLDDAEEVALEQLSKSLDEDVVSLTIEGIKALPNG